MGIRALTCHAREQKHLDLTKQMTHFFSNTNKPSSTETSSKKSLDSATCTMKMPALEVSVVAAQEIVAEIRWAIH